MEAMVILNAINGIESTAFEIFFIKGNAAPHMATVNISNNLYASVKFFMNNLLMALLVFHLEALKASIVATHYCMGNLQPVSH